ncbi:MAG: VWA domain-containing protein [Vicinamibacterales bacterium]
MSPVRRFVVLSVVAALAAVTLRAQAPAPITIRIVSPGPDVYVSGPMLLKAIIEPGPRAREVARVRFFADGKLVCTTTDPVRAECPWDAGAEVAEHVIRAVAEFEAGGRVVTSTRTKALEHVEMVSVEVVQVTAVVTDGRRFVGDLPQRAFRLFEDGIPQTITHFSSEGSPLELVVAVDVSASMGPSMPQLKNAVRRFLAALRPEDQVTLTAFNDNMFTLTRRETSVPQRLRAVDRLAPWGGTALYDVIVRGVQQLSRQSGRRVLVVFSDGDDRTSHATLATVEESVRASDATLFMVALGRGSKETQLRSGIERLVDMSGGRALFVEKSEGLDGAFGEVLEELSNQYLLGYQSTNAAHDGRWRELTIDIPGYGYAVRARQGYRAPGGSER